MLVTEAEAKKLWCPFGRKAAMLTERNGQRKEVIGVTASNRVEQKEGGDQLTSLCLTSACMAWQSLTYGKVPKGYCGMMQGGL